MYNKLFTKIVDSSIWLEPTPTRLLWMMLIAVMDQDGFCQFASAANVAHRARLSVEETEEALATLEAPDPNSADPENDGRRIEKVPGGWMVLNSAKYREIVTKQIEREKTRIRVANHREKKRAATGCNESVTVGNGSVTPSEAVSDAEALTHYVRKARMTLDELKAYCVEQGLPESDGQWLFDKLEGCGWKNNGKPIRDVKATIRSWKGAGYMASQKLAAGMSHPSFKAGAQQREGANFTKTHPTIGI